MNFSKLIVVLAFSSAIGAAHSRGYDSLNGAENDPKPEEQKKEPEKKQNDAFSAAKSSEDYTGKRIEFPVEVLATIKGTDKVVCLPAHTRLRGMSKKTSEGILVTLREPPLFSSFDSKPPKKACVGEEGKSALGPDKAEDQTLVITDKYIGTLPANISGLSYGLLVVPFKYHVTGSKDFNGSGSVGPYAGYKWESAGWGASLETVGFFGLTSVPVERTVDGKITKENLSGVSFGGGVIGRIRDNFQVGLILGADHVSKSSSYSDNGKLWIAVSIGYAFSN